METGAAIGALHPTVAAKEVAAHAEGEAVGVVLAEELVGRDGGEKSHCGTVPVVVHQALCLFQVGKVRQSEGKVLGNCPNCIFRNSHLSPLLGLTIHCIWQLHWNGLSAIRKAGLAEMGGNVS